jgi:anti-anti-sigma factor
VQLTVTVAPAPDRVVVRLRGEADLSSRGALTEGLWGAAGIGDPVEVDLAEVRFCDSSCFGALSAFRSDLDAAGRTCRLVGVPPRTRRLLRLAGREDLLTAP